MWVHRIVRVIDENTVECELCGIVPAGYRTRYGKRVIRCSVAVREQRRSPKRHATRGSRREHGLTPEERDAYLEGRVCDICGTDRNIVVDHCHETGIIRGSLCVKCNSGLGKLGDNLEGVMRAVRYLTR